MAWNMAFGVYEAITTIPQDLQDAERVFGVRDWLRFRRLVFPAMVPKLVYNSMLSWSNGWFFLVASEIFTAFGATFVRPGLGAFIADRGNAGDVPGILVGIARPQTAERHLAPFQHAVRPACLSRRRRIHIEQ